MDSDQKDKSDPLRGFAKDHLTVNHIQQELGKQLTVRHLQQRLNEQALAGNTQTHEQGSSSSNTQTQQGGGDTSQKKD